MPGSVVLSTTLHAAVTGADFLLSPTSLVGRLVPVELAASKSPKQQKPSCGLAVVLSGDRRIEVQRDFDPTMFERLVSLPEPG